MGRGMATRFEAVTAICGGEVTERKANSPTDLRAQTEECFQMSKCEENGTAHAPSPSLTPTEIEKI
jgi:hypothetical protein